MAKEKKNKIEREKELQLKKEREAVIQQALLFSRKRFKKFEEIIVQLYRNEDLSFSFSDRRIWKIHDCFKAFTTGIKRVERKKLRDVFIYLSNTSELLEDEHQIHAVYNMVMFRHSWRSDFFTWKPVSKNGQHQVKELAAYLFCKYKVPEFLYQCFYETRSNPFIHWFIHLGNGGRVKEMRNIPIPFTQKMGHYFLQAPARLTIAEALRWAQVRGLNGDDKLADRIAYSWLSIKPYSHEDFWETFIQLLVNGAMFNLNKTTELIDFVREAKRENVLYTLKGRTLLSVLRQSDAWHKRFSGNLINQVWKPCGIDGYRVEKKEGLVLLEELTESKLLAAEGKTMKHCVGSYALYCAKGKSAIFSMRKYSGGLLLETIATVEVNIALQRVVQAKAKMNQQVSAEARKYMEAWATKEGLVINPYL